MSTTKTIVESDFCHNFSAVKELILARLKPPFATEFDVERMLTVDIPRDETLGDDTRIIIIDCDSRGVSNISGIVDSACTMAARA